MKTRLMALALGGGLQVMRSDELKIGWLRFSGSQALRISSLKSFLNDEKLC